MCTKTFVLHLIKSWERTTTAKGDGKIGKYPDAGRDWELEEKGMTEDEMAGWHHQLDAHEFG